MRTRSSSKTTAGAAGKGKSKKGTKEAAEKGQAAIAAAEERRKNANPLTAPAHVQPEGGEGSMPPVTPQRTPSTSPRGTGTSQRTTRSQTGAIHTTPRKGGRVVVRPNAEMRQHLTERKRAEADKSAKDVRSLSELIELSGPSEWIALDLITAGLETRGLEEDVVQAIYESMKNPSTGKHVIFVFSLHE